MHVDWCDRNDIRRMLVHPCRFSACYTVCISLIRFSDERVLPVLLLSSAGANKRKCNIMYFQHVRPNIFLIIFHECIFPFRSCCLPLIYIYTHTHIEQKRYDFLIVREIKCALCIWWWFLYIFECEAKCVDNIPYRNGKRVRRHTCWEMLAHRKSWKGARTNRKK